MRRYRKFKAKRHGKFKSHRRSGNRRFARSTPRASSARMAGSIGYRL